MTEIEKIREDEIKYCSTRPEYFIEEYCHIEDKDTEEIIVPFKLWPKQKETLNSIDKNRLNIILKARQLGLTWLVLCYCVKMMLCKAGFTIGALSRSETEAAELVRRIGVVLKHMPELIRPEKSPNWSGITYNQLTFSIEIFHPNGKISTFDAFTSSPSAGRSFTFNLLVLDEWAYQQYAREIWGSVFPTINRPTGGQVIGLSSIQRGTLFEDIFTGDFGFNKIFLPWDTDPRRDLIWYENTQKAIGDLIMAEYPATIEEALTIPGGAFFPEVNSKIHIVPKEPISWRFRRYVSIDYGLDTLAALWYAVDFNGYAVIYRQLHEIGLRPSEAAERIRKETGDEKIDDYFAPPDLWNANRDTGRSTAEIFGDYGIWLTRTSNKRDQGWLEVKEWLKPIEVINDKTGESRFTAKLVIQENCDISVVSNDSPDLFTCLIKIQKEKDKPNDAAKKPHNLTHMPDSLRAFAAGRPASTAPEEEEKPKKLIDILMPKKRRAML